MRDILDVISYLGGLAFGFAIITMLAVMIATPVIKRIDKRRSNDQG